MAGEYANLFNHSSVTPAAEANTHGDPSGGFATVTSQVFGPIDNTPRYVAGIVASALALVFILRRLGFRFTVGASAKVGR